MTTRVFSRLLRAGMGESSVPSASPDVPLFSFDDFCRMVGFEDVWAFEEKWKDVLDNKAKKAG